LEACLLTRNEEKAKRAKSSHKQSRAAGSSQKQRKAAMGNEEWRKGEKNGQREAGWD
jgi:hypothetical protein